MNPYPIFLTSLADNRCLVIGGGAMAQNKVQGLLASNADLTVISPTLTPTLQRWASEARFTWLAREYHRGDLRGVFLAIVAIFKTDVTARIWQEAQAEGTLLNTMDYVPHSNFIAGSVVRQGDLVMAISTGGSAPALAVRLRQQFERTFGAEYRTFLAWMKALRTPMKTRYPDFEERRRRWYALVDADILSLLHAGQEATAKQRITDLTGIHMDRELI